MHLTNITMASFAVLITLTLTGCGDCNKDQKNDLTSLQKDVKFLVDTDGMSLYIFDRDTLNTSNCDAECRKIWPIFEGAENGSSDVKVLESTDHLAYRMHPLYYFVNDAVPGNVKGDNVNEIWHLIYAPEGSTDSQTALSETVMRQTYLTDKDGRALYTFDKDEDGVSNCYGECESIWPVYYNANIGNVPTGSNISEFSTIARDANRSDTGVLQQTAYKGKPLYYFTSDNAQSGSTKGDWVNGIWHLVELSAVKRDSTQPEPPSPYTPEAVEKGRVIFTDPAKCSRCHGADGQTKPLGVDNIIAKYGDPVLVEQKLRDMRDNGNPQNRDQIMVDIAKGLSDEAITNLSAFIATLKK